jgi:hypothetical protein
MATIVLTFTTNADQDAALAWMLTRANAERTAQALDPIPDITTMLMSVGRSAMASYFQQYRDAMKAALAAAVDSASPTQLADAASALGVTLP